jgi:hypothetical protein
MNLEAVAVAGLVITMIVIATYKQTRPECESCSGEMIIQCCIENRTRIRFGRKMIELKMMGNSSVMICGTLPESVWVLRQTNKTPMSGESVYGRRCESETSGIGSRDVSHSSAMFSALYEEYLFFTSVYLLIC